MRTELLHILQHSLGLDKHGRNQYPGYQRNHFCAGGRDRDLCRELAGMGYMEERRSSELTGGDPLFIVTDAGKEAIRRESPPPPKLTRGDVANMFAAAQTIGLGSAKAFERGKFVVDCLEVERSSGK